LIRWTFSELLFGGPKSNCRRGFPLSPSPLFTLLPLSVLSIAPSPLSLFFPSSPPDRPPAHLFPGVTFPFLVLTTIRAITLSRPIFFFPPPLFIERCGLYQCLPPLLSTLDFRCALLESPFAAKPRRFHPKHKTLFPFPPLPRSGRCLALMPLKRPMMHANAVPPRTRQPPSGFHVPPLTLPLLLLFDQRFACFPKPIAQIFAERRANRSVHILASQASSAFFSSPVTERPSRLPRTSSLLCAAHASIIAFNLS